MIILNFLKVICGSIMTVCFVAIVMMAMIISSEEGNKHE